MPIIHDPPLDDATPIDRSKVGEMRLALPVLAELLHLPKGLELTDLRVDRDALGEAVGFALRLEGDPMPPSVAEQSPALVHLIVSLETRKDGMSRATAHFAHAPQERWILRNWSRCGSLL